VTALAPARARATDLLRAVLLVDGVGTALVGAAMVLLAEPLADHVATPGWLRAGGLLLLAVGAGMLAVRRASGRRLCRAAAVLAELDLAWAAGTTAALVLLGGTTALGTALVLALVAVCVVMATAKLSLARGAAAGR
jgi:hypothetical protein